MESIIESNTNGEQELITVLNENGYHEQYEVDMRYTVNGKNYISYCTMDSGEMYTNRLEEANGISILHTIDDEEWEQVEIEYDRLWDERERAAK